MIMMMMWGLMSSDVAKKKSKAWSKFRFALRNGLFRNCRHVCHVIVRQCVRTSEYHSSQTSVSVSCQALDAPNVSLTSSLHLRLWVTREDYTRLWLSWPGLLMLTEAVFVCLSQHGFVRRLALTKGLTTGLGSIDSMLRKVVRYRGSSRKTPSSNPNSETFCFASARVFE